MPKDRTLPLLLDALDVQSDESRPLKLIIYGLRSTTAIRPSPSNEYALDYVREHLAERDYYFRYDGNPLVVIFLNGENRDIGEIESRNDYFELRRIRP